MKAHPLADWLVVACDLPNLSTLTLQELIAAYQSESPRLTAYKNSGTGFPEPLCAIYPVGSNVQLIKLAQELDTFSPRKLLAEIGARLVDQTKPNILDNVNTEAENKLHFKKNDHQILYFAQLADLAGKTEKLEAGHLSRSPHNQLKADYQFPHRFDQRQVAINHQLSAHKTPLQDGDQIAFLPPMTGG